MGNITMIVPTQHTKDLNVSFVEGILKNEFPQFTYITGSDHIQVIYKNMVVTDMYFNEDSSYMINFDNNIEELEELEMYDLANKLRELKSINPDLKKTLHTTHSGFQLEKNSIEQFLKDYFKAYIFDEGIHPEFIPPDYQSKNTLQYKKENPSTGTKIVKNFKDFFKKS